MKILLKIASMSLLVLIFMSLFVPTTYVQIKSVFIAVAFGTILVLALNSKVKWSNETIIAVGLVSSFGLANSFHGQIHSNPGAFRVLTVMAAWPVIYGFFCVLLNQPYALKYLDRIFILSLVMVVLYSFLYLGNMAGLVPNWAYFELDMGQLIGFHDGYIEYNLYSISSLLFLMPFFLHRFYILYRAKQIRFNWWLVLIAGFLLSLLTGRRAVQMVIVLVPGIIFIVNMIIVPRASFILKLKPQLSFRLILLVCFILFIFIYVTLQMDINYDVVWNEFWDGFKFSDTSSSASERTGQLNSLMQAWSNGNILFGSGNGAATDYVRSYDMPWAYELTYVYLLFSTGIVGVILYFTWFSWGLLRIKRALAQRPDMARYVAPMITGVFGVAIGAASNPYFGKFDYLWIIMLPHLLAGSIRHQQMENGNI